MTTVPQSTNASVLVTLDGSHHAEQAIPYGRALAGADGALTLLEVLPEPEPVRGLLGDLIATAEEVSETYREDAEKAIAATLDRWRPIVGEASTENRFGEPVEQILTFASENQIAYIAMANRGKGALQRLAFGSVTDAVVRTSPIPVLIVHSRSDEPNIVPATIRRLIVPLDGSELANATLPVVIGLGRRLNVPARVLQAIDPTIFASSFPGTEAYYSAQLYDDLVSAATETGKTILTAAAKQLQDAGLEATWTVVDGSPINAISNEAKDGDIIVMTSHGRSGIKRWIMGSVAESLMRSGPVPVMIVPAPGRAEIEDAA